MIKRFSRPKFSSRRQRLIAVFSLVSVVVLAAGGTAAYTLGTRSAHANATFRFQDSHFSKVGLDDAAYSDNNPDGGAAGFYNSNEAYPATHVAPDQLIGARNAYQGIAANWGADDPSEGWQLVGPTTANVAASATYTGLPAQVSGRITALGIGSVCKPGDCRLYVGAAGGGVWRTDDALAATPSWKSVSNGLFTNAIGSIWVDPQNSQHVLVGTGEANGSSDSEAGLGLFQTWNAGGLWVPVPGSVKVAAGRGIGGIAVDPSNPAHIYIGTTVARHGGSSVSGGRFAPPQAPQVGLYESTNGGATFSLVFSKPSDSVNPGSSNGSDFFRGGVTTIKFDPTTSGRIYFAMDDYGLFRGNTSSGYEQVFASAGGGAYANSSNSRTAFALAPHSGQLRIYLGDLGAGPADFFRVDNANVAASTLTDGTNNPGWTKLSSSTPGTPGYASYNFCEGQCWYDMFVESPAGQPDTVIIGGSMAYGELLRQSNGRAVQRSTDDGVHFTDMTNDETSFNGMHPDQHALIFDPADPNTFFVGSDGGLVRANGPFVDQSNDPNVGCGVRGLSGTDLADCQAWLSAVPTNVTFINAGIASLQFQSVSVNPSNVNDIQGGTQDNGTMLGNANNPTFNQTVGGDGGQSGYDVSNPSIRFHSYYAPQHDVSFSNGAPLSWDWISDPLLASGEAASFYTPMIADPTVGGTMFDGLQHVWRTTDDGGAQSYLDSVCNEYTGTFVSQCGDWQPLGGTALNAAGDLSGTYYGTDKGGAASAGNYVAAITRAPSNNSTMWVATRRGRLFVSTNANASDPNAVTFTRIDTRNTPTRFISGIAVDPNDPNHAFVSFSSYDAYAKAAGTATGHVFDVHFNGTTATWTDISGNIGDQPVTGIAYDAAGHSLYIATDYTVLRLRTTGHNTHWRVAAAGLPLVAVYGITLAPRGGVLYAATHGRGIYRLNIDHSQD